MRLPLFAIALVACGSSPVTNDAGGSDAGVVETSADGASDGGASLAWFPGNYVLLNSADDVTTERDAVLANPAYGVFDGIEKRYDWTACELAKDDYSACIADLKSDLAAVTAAKKKLIVFLTYKTFDTSHAVPSYMLQQGPWCEGTTCGETAMSNGTTAMIWNAGVQDRMRAWISALGAAVGSSDDAIAGIVFPESACGACDKSPGYSADGYLAGLESNVKAAIAAFPRAIAFQYINFFPPSAVQSQYLGMFADFALATPHAGLGCPDLGPLFNPPEYAIFQDPKYAGRVPIAPAVEPTDYTSSRTSSLSSTYSLGTDTFHAQIISWQDTKNAADVFTIDDVAAYLPSHPNPNTAPPTW